MAKNVGSLDRIVRLAIGAGLLALVAIGPHTWWGLIGAIPVATGLTGLCPLYTVLGIATRPAEIGDGLLHL